ncbi:E4 [Betapapillomavirus 2]|uniref:E4 n=1 Tax=Betapapillomavirus 2 TaxID=333924 RepID=A0A2D2AKX6_9PAPI|nr:E4 [Betapapillomavirus 2]
MQEPILWRAILKITIFDLRKMLRGLVLQTSGKCMLIKMLCLPLLLVLRRQLETRSPPTTPFPGRRFGLPPHQPNGHHGTGDTEGNHLALQPPPTGGKKSEKNKDKKQQQGGEKADQGPEAPGVGEGRGPEDPPPEDPPVHPTGEGEVEGGPSPGRDPGRAPEQEGILPGVALLLTKWEQQFDLLVNNIMEELRNYWQMLKTPQ